MPPLHLPYLTAPLPCLYRTNLSTVLLAHLYRASTAYLYSTGPLPHLYRTSTSPLPCLYRTSTIISKITITSTAPLPSARLGYARMQRMIISIRARVTSWACFDGTFCDCSYLYPHCNLLHKKSACQFADGMQEPTSDNTSTSARGAFHAMQP